MPRSKPPRRLNNLHTREHEYITWDEFKRIRAAAGRIGRHRHRDSLMLLMGFRHGLRARELVTLKWEQVDLERRIVNVRRVKNGKPTTHDLSVEEAKGLRKLAAPEERIGCLFKPERGDQFTTRGFFAIVKRAGKEAGYGKPLHPHMLRHGCGFYMTNRGVDIRVIQDWLGHRNIQHTVLYTDLAPERLRGAFPDEE